MHHHRLQIVDAPTPLKIARRLSEEWGVELYIKRDDLAGPTLGGNKSRQLEYYFGDAQDKGADTILITGAVQSNFARLAVSVANNNGMRAVVQLEDRVPGKSASYRKTGNVLLSRLMNAEIMMYPEGEDEKGADEALQIKADELSAAGRQPYIIHLSEGHPPLGALGYVDAATEILSQRSDFDVFVVASGSGSTHAGLLAGLRGAGSKAKVFGCCVRRDAGAQAARINRVLRRLEDLFPSAKQVTLNDVITWDGAFRPGYGQVGKAALDAMRLAARTEGLILDPVYTAKSFAAIPALIASGHIAKGSRVCFVHTGGLAAIFAYEASLFSSA
ncbi:MAG: D-cysteine desulfhydrase family protein [Pseudomonadota bacterium]